MLKIIKRLFPLAKEGELNRLSAELDAEKERRTELEDAVLELGDLYSAQDEALTDVGDALIELAEMITEE